MSSHFEAARWSEPSRRRTQWAARGGAQGFRRQFWALGAAICMEYLTDPDGGPCLLWIVVVLVRHSSSKCTLLIVSSSVITFICLHTASVSPVSGFEYAFIMGKKCDIYLPSVSLEAKTHRCNYLLDKQRHVDPEHIFLASYFPIIFSMPKLRPNFRLLRGSWLSLGWPWWGAQIRHLGPGQGEMQV